MGISAGPVADADTEKLELPDIQVLNEIHRGMGNVMRGYNSSPHMPRFVMLGRNEYQRLISSTFLVFAHEVPDFYGNYHMAEFVMGVEIVKVERDDFLMVV